MLLPLECVQFAKLWSARPMKVKYARDSDTLYIGFRASGIVETRDLDEDTVPVHDALRHMAGGAMVGR